LPTPLKAAATQTKSAGGGGIEMMLVAGYSGIGKSALVAEVHKPMTEKQGYFISENLTNFSAIFPTRLSSVLLTD
jgi:predicted ATPase